MLFLSKEASNKDESLKMQMMLSMKEDKSESSTEFVWKENCSCGDQRTDLTIVKANFPEKTLVYVNNCSITPVKGGHATCLDFVILAQILPVVNPPPGLDLDTQKFKDNEVLIYTPLYNTENGLYRGLTKKLGYITLGVDASETFFPTDLTKNNQQFCSALTSNHCQTYFNALPLKRTSVF